MNARKPHAFDPVQDVHLHISAIGADADTRFGAAADGSRGDSPGSNARDARCAVPGCGKGADDPIHRQPEPG